MSLGITSTNSVTLFPAKTTTSSATVGIRLNPQSPASGISVIDQKGSVIGLWDLNQQKFVPIDNNAEVGADRTPIPNFLSQNQDILVKNTTRILNDTSKITRAQAQEYYKSDSFRPFTAWIDSRQGGFPPTQVGLGTPTVGVATTSSETTAGSLFSGIDISKLTEIKTIDSRDSYPDSKYPAEMPEKMDKIQFRMYSYGIKKPKENFIGFEKERKNTLMPGSVTLGIQPKISDTNTVSWQDLSADALSLAAAAASTDIISEGLAGVEKVLGKIGNTYNADKENIKEYVKLWFAGQAASISGLTARVGGVVLNPNLELLFQNPEIRTFNFNFQLTPRSESEAKEVKNIIRFFKQGSAVQATESELFLKAPNVFSIKYLYGETGGNHPGLNRIKGECALISCSVDYTPSGSYMTFKDGTMVSYNLSLTFRELTPIYASDYKGIDVNDIGF